MASGRPAGLRRAPGSFSPLASNAPQLFNSGPSTIQRVPKSESEGSESSESSDSSVENFHIAKKRSPQRDAQAQSRNPVLTPKSPVLAQQPAAISASSTRRTSRPSIAHSRTTDDSRSRRLPPKIVTGSKSFIAESYRGHARRSSRTQGFFEPSLPTTSPIIPESESVGSLWTPGTPGGMAGLSASQIAAQAAMQHQSQAQHARQRSQTVPAPPHEQNSEGYRRPSRGPVSPPLLSLTEASSPSQNGFGGQSYRHGLLGGNTSAAATAANVVFPRSPVTSPSMPPTDFAQMGIGDKPPPLPKEKSKVKLFGRPGKVSTSKEAKEKPLPSPNKLGSYAMNTLQRNNPSLASLADSVNSSGSSMYSQPNSSSATIRAVDPGTPPLPVEKDSSKDSKEKQHKHHFLSRQKHKLSNKEDHHLPLSSSASNSRPVDPNAPSSLYNFNLPPSPGPGSASFAKSMSGLDLRHGGRALREKRKEEKAASTDALKDPETPYTTMNEWPGGNSFTTPGGSSYLGQASSGYAPSLYGNDLQDFSKYGLNNMTAEDVWPFLKAKLLVVFEGEELRWPIEDLNRLVSIHTRSCIQKHAPQVVIEDLRDLLHTGFRSLDQTLRRISDDRLIPQLIEMWLFTFTSILPFMTAVFLPLDLEFAGRGPLMSAPQAATFWSSLSPTNSPSPTPNPLEVRRIVLSTYRDTIVLPRFDTLKQLFSRLSLESINSNLLPSQQSLLSSSPDSLSFVGAGRPGTAMSLDPSLASYNSQSTTLLSGSLGDHSSSVGTPADRTARSRAISNVSFNSDHRERADSNSMPPPPPPTRPFTPSSTHPAQPASGWNHTLAGIRERENREREANNEDSKFVTEMVGRMLQCCSVLAGLGAGDGSGSEDEDERRKMDELCRALKRNWLVRGRTGRNRRGIVPPRMTTGQGTPGAEGAPPQGLGLVGV